MSPGGINYDEESYNDSGNTELNNRVGVDPIKSGTSLDGISLFISYMTYMTVNTDMVPNANRIFGQPPDVASFVFMHKFAPTGCNTQDIPHTRITEIGLANLTEREVDFVKLSWKMMDNNNRVVSSGHENFNQGLQEKQILLLFLSPDYGVFPNGYTVTLDTTFYSGDFNAKTTQIISP